MGQFAIAVVLGDGLEEVVARKDWTVWQWTGSLLGSLNTAADVRDVTYNLGHGKWVAASFSTIGIIPVLGDVAKWTYKLGEGGKSVGFLIKFSGVAGNVQGGFETVVRYSRQQIFKGANFLSGGNLSHLVDTGEKVNKVALRSSIYAKIENRLDDIVRGLNWKFKESLFNARLGLRTSIVETKPILDTMLKKGFITGEQYVGSIQKLVGFGVKGGRGAIEESIGSALRGKLPATNLLEETNRGWKASIKGFGTLKERIAAYAAAGRIEAAAGRIVDGTVSKLGTKIDSFIAKRSRVFAKEEVIGRRIEANRSGLGAIGKGIEFVDALGVNVLMRGTNDLYEFGKKKLSNLTEKIKLW